MYIIKDDRLMRLENTTAFPGNSSEETTTEWPA